MNTYHRSFVKRFLDICFSLVILPFAIPVFIVSVLMVLISSGFPIFFFQERIGYHGKAFKLVKIRSLKNTFSSEPGAIHDLNDITAVGKFLRKSRIDEIPQIWNIIKGEMSWVGPRPEVPFYYNHFKNIEATYADRQLARPGITGLAQLDNPNASPNENLEKLKFDLDYVRRADFWLDIRIILRSFLFVWKK